jgi:hypothetical protein
MKNIIPQLALPPELLLDPELLDELDELELL